MAILKRFSSDLENKLNQLYYMNFVMLERWEILCWFGSERISKSNWADIVEMWDGWFEEGEQVPLKIIRCDSTSAPQRYVLIRGDAIQDITEFAE
ncbi:hypothetical protein [Citrobacter europaeus]|uniref:Uncharacterized protein n=1 Tax=Citrobacter europaeus TaxID=1914243 RepID=A0ABY0JQZ6_9ENTR|nr:hypothetical protein [Citrobacter europaeus]SBW25554.1 hypothetical protein BN4901_2555 [Citrobacter europaeus]HBU6124556.1 hypothetical protein [Citrobacter freundii]